MTLHDLATQAAARLDASADRNGDAYFLNVPVAAATEDDDDRTQMVTLASGPAGILIATDVGVIAPSIDLGAALEEAAAHQQLALSARREPEGRVLVVSAHAGAGAGPEAVASLVAAVAAFADRLERSYFEGR